MSDFLSFLGLIGFLVLIGWLIYHSNKVEMRRRQQTGRFSTRPLVVEFKTCIGRDASRELIEKCLLARGATVASSGEALIMCTPTTFLAYGITVKIVFLDDPLVFRLSVGMTGGRSDTPVARQFLAALEGDWYTALSNLPGAPQMQGYYRSVVRG